MKKNLITITLAIFTLLSCNKNKTPVSEEITSDNQSAAVATTSEEDTTSQQTVIDPIARDQLQVIPLEMHGTYGDSAIIKYNDYEILVDAGTQNDAKYVQAALKEYVTDKVLDMVILSHLHADHIGWMSAPTFFEDIGIDVKAFIDTGNAREGDQNSVNYIRIRDSYIEKGASYYPLADLLGDKNYSEKFSIAGKDNLYLQFFESNNKTVPGEEFRSSDMNASSVTFTLNYDDVKFFFAGDLPSSSETAVVNHMKEADPNFINDDSFVVYKASHHGSKGSNGYTILDYLKPQICYAQAGLVGANKRAEDAIKEQHPYIEALNRMKSYTENVYWTSINGVMEMTSYGEDVRYTFKGRTVDYYYNNAKVDRQEERYINVFQSKYYQSLSGLI